MDSLFEEVILHVNQFNRVQVKFLLLQYSISIFPIPSSWEVSYIIQLPLDLLDPMLVDHLSPYLSICPIRHPLWLFMSCDCQGSTVQESSPHKCGQKSSCSAFNAVVAAFPQIFLSFYHSGTFMMHVPIIGTSQKITLVIKIHTGAVPSLSEEMFLLGPPFTYSLLMRLQTEITYSYLFLLGPFVSLDKAQGPIYTLGP